MLLTIDIGNSSTKFSVFDGEQIVERFRKETEKDETAEAIIESVPINRASGINGIAISSVVRELRGTYESFGQQLTGSTPLFADHTTDLGFSIRYETPADCGPDRLVAAFAAVEKLGNPVIICDFGTATTIDLVNEENEYCGGIISPGIETMANSLFANTSRLPKIEIGAAHRVVGNSTERSIRSGIYFGYLGLVDGVIARIQSQHETPAPVIATGGYADLISRESEYVNDVEPDLIHFGLMRIWANQK